MVRRSFVQQGILLALDPRDVFVTTACVGGVFKYGFRDAERLIIALARHFRDSFMLEVQYHNTSKQKEVNEFLLRLNAKHGIPLIAGIDNGGKASHGELLKRIYDSLMFLIPTADVLVREKGFSRFPKETQALFKVVGIADLAAWQCGENAFNELAPTTVKKILTGSGKASKQDVAEALLPHVGHLDYACDDESDAIAVGVAWLIQNEYMIGEIS